MLERYKTRSWAVLIYFESCIVSLVLFIYPFSFFWLSFFGFILFVLHGLVKLFDISISKHISSLHLHHPCTSRKYAVLEEMWSFHWIQYLKLDNFICLQTRWRKICLNLLARNIKINHVTSTFVQGELSLKDFLKEKDIKSDTKWNKAWVRFWSSNYLMFI